VHVVTTERVSLAGNRASLVILSLRRTTEVAAPGTGGGRCLRREQSLSFLTSVASDVGEI